MKKVLQAIMFYILSFTWGIIMSAAGTLCGLALLITGHKPQLFHHYIHFQVGKSWGGVNLGPVFITDNTPTLHTKQHEAGHGIQNIILGPLMPFVVSMPSALRYWLYRAAEKRETGLFCSVAFLVIIIVFAILLISTIFNIGIVFTSILFMYICILFIWSVFKESVKYEDKPFPEYDAIWFEGSATKLGEKYFREEKEI